MGGSFFNKINFSLNKMATQQSSVRISEDTVVVSGCGGQVLISEVSIRDSDLELSLL